MVPNFFPYYGLYSGVTQKGTRYAFRERHFIVPTIYPEKGLITRLPSCFVIKTPGINGLTNSFPVDGEVADLVLSATEADQSIRTAMIASFGERSGFSLDVILPVSVLNPGNSVSGEIQDVRRHSLSGVNPICFLFSMGGSINWRIASNKPMMASS